MLLTSGQISMTISSCVGKFHIHQLSFQQPGISPTLRLIDAQSIHIHISSLPLRLRPPTANSPQSPSSPSPSPPTPHQLNPPHEHPRPPLRPTPRLKRLCILPILPHRQFPPHQLDQSRLHPTRPLPRARLQRRHALRGPRAPKKPRAARALLPPHVGPARYSREGRSETRDLDAFA